MTTATGMARSATPEPDDVDPERIAAAAPLGADAALDLASRRIAELLGPRGTEDLLAFLESGSDGTYVIVRTSDNSVIGERSIGDEARRRSA